MNILLINGPNLNLLGTREPEIYGSLTLDDIQKFTENETKNLGASLTWYQSNIEGEIVDKIQAAINDGTEAIVINPAAFSHTSVAILDALKMYPGIKVEVHLSNTNQREEFRKTKITAQGSDAVLEGLGKYAYAMGIRAALSKKD